MIGYLAAYAGGIVTGVGLLLAHQYSVKRAVQIEQAKAKREGDKYRAQIDRLKEDCQAWALTAETQRAKAEGKIIGIQKGRNMTEAENLVRKLEGEDGKRTVKIGGVSK